jgi:hypothetical protein
MGEQQSRPVSLAGVQKDRRHIQPTGKRGGRVAVAVLVMVAVLGLAANPAGSAASQDPPAKKDAAAKADAPPGSAPDAPTQEPDPAAAEALSVRYRFIERYSTTEDPNHPERITQYRVGARETQKVEHEKQQGAPNRSQFSRQTIYTEQPALVSKLGEVISAVRRYDRFQLKGIATARTPVLPFFEGLTIFYKLRPGQKPMVLNLTEDHPLREFEYRELTKQVMLPQLTALLPTTPRRVRDTWPISPKAAHCLVGELPENTDFELTGTLLEVHRASGTPNLTAVIGVSGQMNLTLGLSSLNARLHFVFKPMEPVLSTSRPEAAPKSPEKSRSQNDEGIVDARGHIARVLMAWTATNIKPDEEVRLKQTTTYELDLERRLSPASEAIPGGTNTPVAIPETLPVPSEANSWVLYEDNRFHFRHPQELEIGDSPDPNLVNLVEKHPRGDVILGLYLQPKETDPALDRQNRDPEYHRRHLYSTWQKQKKDVVRGSTGWLPDADWGPLKRKVYRIEAALLPEGEEPANAKRLYLDYYLALFNSNESVLLTALTEQDSNLKLREVSEGILKSFNFGKLDAQPKAGAATPAPPLTPPG